MRRRGSVIDIGYNLLVVFLMAVGVVLLAYVYSSITGSLPAFFTSNGFSQSLIDTGWTSFNVLGNAVVIMWGILFMASLGFSYMVRTSPVFIIPTVVFLGVSVWMAATFSNIFKMILSFPGVTPVANRFTILVVLLRQYPFAAFGMGILVIIAMFVVSGGREVNTV